jgi:hypothetical protein
MAANATRSFYAPAGELTTRMLRDLLGLISLDLPPRADRWTPLEQLHASDNPVRRRPRPSLLS